MCRNHHHRLGWRWWLQADGDFANIAENTFGADKQVASVVGALVQDYGITDMEGKVIPSNREKRGAVEAVLL